MNNLDQVIQTITVFAIPVLFAISLHEAAHGYVARYFGDNTAEQLGRLTPNPLKHIDPVGTILLPLILFYLEWPPFGYAKPVPVDYNRLRNPKKQMGFVAAAGPAANFAMGLGWMLLYVVLKFVGVEERFPLAVCGAGVLSNAVMCAFNLLPIPPLDGGRVVTSILPRDLAHKFASIERLGPIIFLVLILLLNTGPFRAMLNSWVNLVQYMIQLPFLPFLS